MDPASLSGLLENLPTILTVGQAVFYLSMIFLAGGIAARGLKKLKLNFLKKLGIKVGLGALCLVVASSLSHFLLTDVKALDNMVVRLAQIDFIISCAIAGVVVGLGLYLVMKKKPKHRAAGIAVLAILVVFIIVFFNGFPLIVDDIASVSGLPKEVFESGGGECVSPLVLASKYGADIQNLPQHKDDEVKKLVQEETGNVVVAMYKLEHNNKDYVVAATVKPGTSLSTGMDLSKLNMCTTINKKMCSCIDLSALTDKFGGL